MTATINGQQFDVSSRVGRLVAADAVQEQCGPKDEWRAELMRELSELNWPADVLPSDRFTSEVLYRVRDAFEAVIARWHRQDVPVSIAELTPGVVGIRAYDFRAVVRTRDVGRTLAGYASDRIRERVSLIIQSAGHDYAAQGRWTFPDEPEVATDLAALIATTEGNA